MGRAILAEEAIMERQIHLRISGRVQGVCYRAYASEKAQALGLRGWVRNCVDGSVELLAEGEDRVLESLIDWCHQGSPWAEVEAVHAQWSTATHEHRDFRVTATG